MEQNMKTGPERPETKTRIPVWLYPSTLEAIDRVLDRDNCKSRSEFIEKAIRFYAGYISGKDAAEFLPAALVSALRATLQGSEDRIARLLFKLTVETGMMMNVLASGMEIPAGELDRLRGICIRDIKRSNGSISLKDAVNRHEAIE